MRVAERIAGVEAAMLCGVLGATCPPLIVFGSRAMTEMASIPAVAFAVLLTFDRNRAKLILAGCLAGLAIYLRFQNGLIAVALLVWLLAQRRARDAVFYAAGAVALGLAGGLLDLFTWGTAFHSFAAYVQFNVVEGRSAEYGIAPFWYYFEVFWTAVGVPVIAIAIGLIVAAPRSTALLAITVVYIAAHSAVPHKEFRFVMPIVPLMLALASAGLVTLIDRLTGRLKTAAGNIVRPAVGALAMILAVPMGWQSAYASFDDFGQREGTLSGPQPVWHAFEQVNRLLWTAGRQPDICGLAMVEHGPVWTGGYTYFHRDVPIIWTIGVDPAPANYVLAHVDVPLHSDYTTVETIGNARLARRPGGCRPPPPSYSRLFPRQ